MLNRPARPSPITATLASPAPTAGPAAAGPGTGEGLVVSPVVCNGELACLSVPKPVGSAPAFIEGVTYIALELTGTTADDVVFDEVWQGNQAGLGAAVTCIDHDAASGLIFTAIAAPAHP